MSYANTIFIFLSSILVLFMTSGLAFFYGGLSSKKNVVNTMLSVFMICSLAIVMWMLIGYSLSFSGGLGGIIGNFKAIWFHGVALDNLTPTKIPESLYIIFEMMFAIITPALFVGAVVGRMRFKFLFIFIIFWSILVYYPMVHMVWGHGFLSNWGILDFAGGTVVHINAGVTALVLSAFLGPRFQYEPHAFEPYNILWALLGTSVLWIGWYGFNVGSALAINEIAIQSFLTTTVAAAAGMFTWMALDTFTKGNPTLIGTCTGVLCGLVGITPACGYVTSTGAFLIGVLAAAISYGYILLVTPKIKIDDALDVFGCHGLSGIVGSILTGLFATNSVNRNVQLNGLFYGGGFKLLKLQLFGTIFTMIFTTIMCVLIIVILKRFIKMRVNTGAEIIGLDQIEHGEVADHTISIDENLNEINK